MRTSKMLPLRVERNAYDNGTRFVVDFSTSKGAVHIVRLRDIQGYLVNILAKNHQKGIR